MAPRRNHPATTNGSLTHEQVNGAMRCCAPQECLRATINNNGQDELIRLDDLHDVVKVTCNNDHCTVGRYMHRECFDSWEQTVLTYLKSCGRARSWSERQRHQNLWTKKGYDLAFKACSCKCGRGHLKKDLDWSPPGSNGCNGVVPRDGVDEIAASAATKKKKRRNKNSRPALAVAAHHNGAPMGGPLGGPMGGPTTLLQPIGGELRARTGSLSSGSTGSASPPTVSGCPSPAHPSALAAAVARRKNFFTERHGSSGNGIFSRRLDFSAFNMLPRHKLNSYHIKMEDEGNHGNDETRCLILSTLAAHQCSRVSCLLCRAPLPVYDRYPLIDGTFFLSPRQHSVQCVNVKVDGRTQYLSAVCMSCLEERSARCSRCGVRWDGSSLVLGTMYSYDIFAAMPCCVHRLRCNSCLEPLLRTLRLNYFSDYSQELECPHCGVTDTHFIKPLTSLFELPTP